MFFQFFQKLYVDIQVCFPGPTSRLSKSNRSVAHPGPSAPMVRQIKLSLSLAPGDSGVPFIVCVINSLSIFEFVEFYVRIWIVVFFSFISLCLVRLLCECCRVSLV